MSALSTPGGGGTTAQSKPTSGKQKFQKLDINSLYCANRNESSEPSLAKSQLSRKHGMQSLGKVPSARRPPANLPSLRTETGLDPNANSVSTVTATVSTPATCTSQTITTVSNSGAGAGTGSAGWVPLPPPSSPHFRTEFPSLEAAAQPSHRSSDHSVPQPQLRPQTEGSWTCGGTAGARPETTSSPVAAPACTPAAQQTPAYRAILPSFLMKGSSATGIGLGTLSSLRDNRSNASSGSGNNNPPGPRQAPRAPAAPRADKVLQARPILREEEISSLDDISRDAGWAQNDDIDYDQKLDFSDGESSTPTVKVGNKSNNRTSIDNERVDPKIQDPDEEQLWAERRQKQSNEVAQAVARARQRKEEEQRRQMRDSPAAQPPKDMRDKERTERDIDPREKDRVDTREKDRSDVKDKDRNDFRDRDMRDKDRLDSRDRDRLDRFDNRDRDREREKERLIDSKDRTRSDNRDRSDSEKDRDVRDRDRNDNRDRNDRVDRDRPDRDRFDRDRERNDRDGRDRADRERGDRDRDREFRDRDRERDYQRDRDQQNPFSKTFQQNIPPRFLKQQQNRQQDDQHKAWSFTNKPAPRRQEPPQYNAPRHNANHTNNRRSYSRDYSDREDDVRRDRDGPGPQWRSEMQDYDRSGRDLDRSNSKDSYKEFNDYKDRRNESDKKSIDTAIEHSSRTAADKLTEVFERKSIGLTEPFASADSSTPAQAPERRITPPSHAVQPQRESYEKDLSKTSWAEVTQEEQSNALPVKLSPEKDTVKPVESQNNETLTNKESPEIVTPQQMPPNIHNNLKTQNQSNNYHNNHIISNVQPVSQTAPNQQTNIINPQANIQTPISSTNQSQSSIFTDSQPIPKSVLNQSPPKSISSNEPVPNPSQIHKQPIQEPSLTVKPTITVQKSEKELSESESIASKSSTDPSAAPGNSLMDSQSVESIQDSQKRPLEDKKNERYSMDQVNKIPMKEPVERKSSGSGSEKKGRGYGSGGYNVYGRGWGSRESRGRRSHRSSRSNNRASESDGSTDGNNMERKERRRAPRSPRGVKKQDRPEDMNQAAAEQGPPITDGLENREPFAPRGQPSRRGRGGFQGASRPPAPAKRVTGYGPPNTKSPFSQASRAVKDHEEIKDSVQEDKGNKSRTGSSSRKGRDRRTKGGAHSGEDENWETTSEHSESGGHHRSGGRQSAQSKVPGGSRNQNSRQNANRGQQAAKKDGDNKNTDLTEAISDLKISAAKKDEVVVDDGFQEVRNKKNSKETRAPTSVKEEKQPRSRSNQGNGRNGSSTRSSNDKSITRGSAPVPGKPNSQYDRPRQANLAPRFVKQRQKQQMGLIPSFGPDTGAAPPPPTVNAWDKPISQTLRGNVEEPPEVIDAKSSQSSQRSTPGDPAIEIKPVVAPCALVADKTGVLDGATPPVETIIFENTNYKTAPPAEALKQKYQSSAATAKPQTEEIPAEMEARPMAFNGDMRDVRARPRSIQEIMAETGGRPVSEAEGSLGLQMSFDTSQKAEESDMKLDFAFDSDLGQLTEDKTAKTLGLPRGTHMSTSNTISAADLNFKIASVKKVWEMPAVVEGGEELQFAGLEETSTETGAPPNVCKVKPTQQLQSPPPSHYNHVSYQGGYGGLSVPSPPAVLFNSTQPMMNSTQQLPQQGGLYGAFLDQTRTQFGGFPGTPYGAGSATPYNYQPPPDMFQSLPNQYRMGPAGSGAAFGQSAQMGNSPSTVLISSTTNSHMSTVKPSTQQIGAIGSKGAGVGGIGGGGVNTFQQQYLGYSGPEAQYSLTGLLPRPAPPATSYYSPYQPPTAPAPTYPLQFTQPAVQQSSAFSSQFLSSQLHAAAAAAVQQMQQQYRAPPLQTQYAPPQPRPPPQQQLKSPLHEHANGFAPLCDSASPTPKGAPKPQKPPHSPPHKYHAPPPHQPHQQHVPHPPPAHTPHQHHQHQQHPQHQQQMVVGGNNGRGNGAGGNGNAMSRSGMVAPRYPAPIQRPHAPALPMYRAPPAPQPPRAHHAPRPNHQLYYHHHQRNGGGGSDRVPEGVEVAASVEDVGDGAPAGEVPAPAEVKAD